MIHTCQLAFITIFQMAFISELRAHHFKNAVDDPLLCSLKNKTTWNIKAMREREKKFKFRMFSSCITDQGTYNIPLCCDFTLSCTCSKVAGYSCSSLRSQTRCTSANVSTLPSIIVQLRECVCVCVCVFLSVNLTILFKTEQWDWKRSCKKQTKNESTAQEVFIRLQANYLKLSISITNTGCYRSWHVGEIF